MIDGNLLLLKQYVVTDVSSVPINSQISGSYDQYVVKFNITPSTDSTELRLYLSFDNGVTVTGQSFYDASSSVRSSGETGNSGNQNTKYWVIAENMGASSVKSTFGEIRLFNMVDVTKYPSCFFQVTKTRADSLVEATHGAGRLNSIALALDAILFNVSSGTMSGTFNFYGVEL